ncbi:hypothetical protein [Achromobacter aegrifaciens]
MVRAEACYGDIERARRIALVVMYDRRNIQVAGVKLFVGIGVLLPPGIVDQRAASRYR